jgi:DNA-binding CsgD family transcriptional regulator
MRAPESYAPKSHSTENGNGLQSWRPALGVVVADASLKPLFANQEALFILNYPAPLSQNIVDVFHRKLRPGLSNAGNFRTRRNGADSILMLKSGRRTYFCRVFPLNSDERGGNGCATLLILERRVSERLALSQLSRQFQLTQREHQAVSLLLQGLSNKEMANNMGISANTVKVFLRMAMIRMGVSSRSGIVIKILGSLLSSSNSE